MVKLVKLRNEIWKRRCVSQMDELYKEGQRICAICGKSIERGYSVDHVYPRAIYKWSEKYLSRDEQNQLVDSIESDGNYVKTHRDCNMAKEDTMPEIDKLYLTPEKKQELQLLGEKIRKELENYTHQKSQLLQNQNGKCIGCGCDLQEGVLRRKDPKMPRIWENACVVCHECNLKRERFC
ncbi:MAG: hypothetical protein K6G19_02935 [Lachnospiraceae bacterium]|nr:hypothetical protein [Lachnospiraceae bacterium]